MSDTPAVPPTARTWQPSARPGFDQRLAAVRQGDTLVVPKLDLLARSVPDASAMADRLLERGVKLALGRTLYDPDDPMGKMCFDILATFAEFEADLIRMRTREGMAIARARGKLRGKQSKPSDRQQRELCRMNATGEYSISDLAELFSVSRPTVYRMPTAPFPLTYDPALYRNRPEQQFHGVHHRLRRTVCVQLSVCQCHNPWALLFRGLHRLVVQGQSGDPFSQDRRVPAVPTVVRDPTPI